MEGISGLYQLELDVGEGEEIRIYTFFRKFLAENVRVQDYSVIKGGLKILGQF